MFAQIIGPVDANAAFALIALFAMITIITTASVVKRRSRRALDHDFELAKMKQHDESALAEKNQQRIHETELLKIDANKQIEFKRIDENMLTSHARDVSPKSQQ